MNLRREIEKIPNIYLISSLAKEKGIKVYLIGGFLRDIFLQEKKEFLDFDFTVEKDTLGFLKSLVKITKAKMITLDEERKSWRVVIKKEGETGGKEKVYTFDFTEFRGKDLKEDIFKRDFTVNTLCVELNRLPKIEVIDYFGAREDIRRRRLRVLNEEVLIADPLRILRAFTFLAKYGFRLQRETENLIKKYCQLLKGVSGERINEELFKILATPTSYKVIRKMSELFVIDAIIPHISSMRDVSQGAYHHLDVWQHSLETLLRFEIIYKRRLVKNKDIVDYLNEELAKNRRRIQILKLACLLHDVGKPFAKREKEKKTIFHQHEKIGRDLSEEISSRLKLSFREREVLKQLIFWHLRPGYLADMDKPSPRAIYRFFRDTGPEGVGVILLSLADWRATRGPLTDEKKRKRQERRMFKLIEQHFAEKKKKPLPRLVDGYGIMKRFNLHPSPLIGKILSKIKEEQTLGKISTPEEAYQLAEKIIAS